MDLDNLLQGGLAAIVCLFLGIYVSRIYMKNDNKDVKCSVHSDRLNEFDRRLSVAETTLIAHSNEHKDTKELLFEIQKDIKQLLQR